MGKAVRADLAAAWRDRGPRWSAAAGPAQRACPGDGGYRRDRHRLVGHQGESRRFAGVPVIRRREPTDLHLCDRLLTFFLPVFATPTNYALVLQKLAGFAFWETYVITVFLRDVP